MIDIEKTLNIIIIGYGISGKSVYNFLKKNGHNVSVYEDGEQDVPNKISNINWKNTDLVVKSPSIKIMPSNCHQIIQEAKDAGVEIVSTFDIFKIYNPNARIIAITGTNGKSTTASLLYHILSKSEFSVQLGGNIGVPYDTLKKANIYIFEMSSYELASSKYLDFDIAAVLNIELDHMEFHESFENYINAKHSALDHAKLKIISEKDERTSSIYQNQPNTIKIFDKSQKNADADIYIYENTLIDNKTPILDLSRLNNLQGKHNHQNILFAHRICKELGLAPKEIAKHISTFKPLPHRIEPIIKIKNVLFVNDSKATNAASTAKALEAFFGYKIFLLAGGVRKKTSPLPMIQKYFIGVEKIYLFGESSNDFSTIFKNHKQTTKCETMRNAIFTAFHDAKKESCPAVILLSPMCASFDQFKNFEDRGETFSKIARGFG